MAVAIGIANFRHHCARLVGVVMAPEHADRVEDVAERPRTRQHQYSVGRQALLGQEMSDVHVVLAPHLGTPPGQTTGLGQLV